MRRADEQSNIERPKATQPREVALSWQPVVEVVSWGREASSFRWKGTGPDFGTGVTGVQGTC